MTILILKVRITQERVRQSPDGLEVERKGEQRLKRKKSGFQVDNVGL